MRYFKGVVEALLAYEEKDRKPKNAVIRNYVKLREHNNVCLDD
jgi:hypothetical protein